MQPIVNPLVLLYHYFFEFVQTDREIYSTQKYIIAQFHAISTCQLYFEYAFEAR
jgi:hypothetical protein